MLEDVQCTGVESNILACPTSAMGEINNPLCYESNRVAGVRCNLEPGCFDSAVRLVNGSGFYEGRLEVCANNQWVSVCGAGFDVAAASDVCTNRLLLNGGTYTLHLTCQYFHCCTCTQMPHQSMVVCMALEVVLYILHVLNISYTSHLLAIAQPAYLINLLALMNMM